LLAAARNGEAFNVATGEPVSWQREEPGTTWYEFACSYVDMKWKTASAKYRRAIAQALAAATPAMFTSASGRRADQDVRSALVNWGYNTKQRADAPRDVEDILTWLARNTSETSASPTPHCAVNCSPRPPPAWTTSGQPRPPCAGTARSCSTPLNMPSN